MSGEGDTRGSEERCRLRSGHEIWVRPVRREDAAALRRAFDALSERSRYQRFMSGTPHLSPARAEQLADLDHVHHHALMARPARGAGDVVGVARFIRDVAHPAQAELALTVADEWHRRGVATVLLAKLVSRARDSGIEYFVLEMLTDNRGMAALLRAAGGVSEAVSDQVVSGRLDLSAAATRQWLQKALVPEVEEL